MNNPTGILAFEDALRELQNDFGHVFVGYKDRPKIKCFVFRVKSWAKNGRVKAKFNDDIVKMAKEFQAASSEDYNFILNVSKNDGLTL